jgi:hypothetical protein
MNKPKVSRAKATKPAARKANAKVKAKTKASKPAARKRSASDNQKLAQLVEEAIDKGANTAEEIHRSVMDMPLTVLESLGLASAAKKVKKVQDSSIGALYELIHEINHSVGRLAKDMLKQRKSTKK